MDTPKISKLLRLMKLLTGNVSRTIDQLAAELGITPRTVYRYIDTIREAGFVVNKLYGNVFAMGKVARGLTDFNRLIYFTEEEAYMTEPALPVISTILRMRPMWRRWHRPSSTSGRWS